MQGRGESGSRGEGLSLQAPGGGHPRAHPLHGPGGGAGALWGAGCLSPLQLPAGAGGFAVPGSQKQSKNVEWRRALPERWRARSRLPAHWSLVPTTAVEPLPVGGAAGGRGAAHLGEPAGSARLLSATQVAGPHPGAASDGGAKEPRWLQGLSPGGVLLLCAQGLACSACCGRRSSCLHGDRASVTVVTVPHDSQATRAGTQCGLWLYGLGSTGSSADPGWDGHSDLQGAVGGVWLSCSAGLRARGLGPVPRPEREGVLLSTSSTSTSVCRGGSRCGLQGVLVSDDIHDHVHKARSMTRRRSRGVPHPPLLPEAHHEAPQSSWGCL